MSAPDGAVGVGTRTLPAEGGVGRARRAAMAELAELLSRSGYRQYYPVVAGDAPFAPSLGHALAVADDLGGEEGALLRLLAVGRPVADELLTGDARSAIAALAAAGLATRGPDGVATTGWVVVPALGGHLLTGTPPTYQTSGAIGASAYLGADSLRLAAALPDARGRRVLDLGTGCGVQGLLAVPGASEAVLTDVEERSLELAACNAALNAVAHRVTLVPGDCYEPVAGERFDLVVALPPYLPEVEASGTRPTVAAGRDGLGVLRRVLAGAEAHLAPGGELVARAQLICGDDGPLLAAELDELAPGLDRRLVLSDWHPLQPYLADLATRLAAHGASSSAAALMERYGASLRGLGATGVCSALVVLRRPASGGPGATAAIGARPLPRAVVAAPAAGLRLSQDPTSRAAVVPGGAPVLLDGPTAALLAAVDGRRGVAELVAAAWGSPAGALAEDLADQARERLAQLASSGLVRLGGQPGSA